SPRQPSTYGEFPSCKRPKRLKKAVRTIRLGGSGSRPGGVSNRILFKKFDWASTNTSFAGFFSKLLGRVRLHQGSGALQTKHSSCLRRKSTFIRKMLIGHLICAAPDCTAAAKFNGETYRQAANRAQY